MEQEGEESRVASPAMSLELLQVGDGDCLLLSYGRAGRMRHVLVDGGRKEHYPVLRARLAEIHESGGRIDLLVCTHYDEDHIGGLVALASDPQPPVTICEVWFNGYDQISSVVPMGTRHADNLSELMRRRGCIPNCRFGGGAVMVPDDHRPATLVLGGGLLVTVLSPDRAGLERQLQTWEDARATVADQLEIIPAADEGWLIPMSGRQPPAVLDRNILASGQESPDRSVGNGGSIALLVEYFGKRVLLAADAHPEVLVRSITCLVGEGRLPVDLVKVPHHGSSLNTTRRLAGLLDCGRFAFSSNGRHNHPAPESVAKLLFAADRRTLELCFNYRQPWTSCWSSKQTMNKYDYVCRFPDSAGRLVIDV